MGLSSYEIERQPKWWRDETKVDITALYDDAMMAIYDFQLPIYTYYTMTIHNDWQIKLIEHGRHGGCRAELRRGEDDVWRDYRYFTNLGSTHWMTSDEVEDFIALVASWETVGIEVDDE